MTDRLTLSLFEPTQAHRALTHVWTNAKAALMAGHRLTLELRPEKRSDAQNRRLWSMLSDISAQVNWHGHKLTSEEWKDVFSAALKRTKVVPGLDGGFVVCGQSTSRMTKPPPQLALEQAKMQQQAQATQMELQYKAQADEMQRRQQAELEIIRQQAQQQTDTNPEADRAENQEGQQPNAESPDEDKDEAETTDDSPDDGGEEPAEEPDPTSSRKFKVTVKGEDGADLEQEVDEKELVAGYQRHSDYTRKMQGLSQREEQAAEIVRTRVMMQIGTQLGLGGKSSKETLDNTRAAMQAMAQLELDAASQMKGQGQITESERAILRKAASGDISMSIGEIKTLSRVARKTAERAHRRMTDIG